MLLVLMEFLDEILERLSISHIEIRNTDTTAGNINFEYEYKEKNRRDK